MTIHSIQESNALLLFRVGPVLVCSPTMPVEAVIVPPKITVPPGANIAEPGVFKSIHGIVRLIDLRVRFGVDEEDRAAPGKVIITEVEGGHAGFWVDEIEDVISFPESGWGQVPAYIPRDVFSRTLMQEKTIRLYADLENLDKFKSSGYLRKHIDMIKLLSNENISEESELLVDKKTLDSVPSSVSEVENINSGEADSEPNLTEGFKITEDKKIDHYKEAVKNIDKQHKDEKKIKPVKSEDVVDTNKNNNFKINDARVKQKKSQLKDAASSFIQFDYDVKSSQYHSHMKPSSASSFESFANKNENESIYKPHEISEKNADKNILVWGGIAVVALMLVFYFAMNIVMHSETSLSVNKRVDSSFDDYKKHGVDSLGVDPLGVDPLGVEKNLLAADEKRVVKPYKVALPIENESLEAASVEITKSDSGVLIVVNNFIESADDSEIENNVDEAELFESSDEKVVKDSLKGVSSKSPFKMLEKKASDLGVEKAKKKERSEVKKTTLQPSMKKYIHRVVKGDTLWHIAKKYVNNPWRYPELAKLSNIKNPDLIYPGDQVTIIINYRYY